MEMTFQPMIYFPVGGEKDGLCINDLNTPKLGKVPQKILKVFKVIF